MLVLSRKEGERLKIGDNIWITLVRCGHGKARIGIEAPEDTVVLRDEIVAAEIKRANSEIAIAQN